METNSGRLVATLGAQCTEEAAMTITLDIRPETEDALARQAAAHGLGVEAFAVSLLEEAAHGTSARPVPAVPKDMVELFAPLRGLNLDFERDRDTSRDINL
jgi:hypothetical protein